MLDSARANRLFSMVVLFAAVCAVLLALAGSVLIEPFLVAYDASGVLFEDALLYARILLVSLPFYIVQNTFQSFFTPC